jgi:hypothetical protein
MRSEKTIPPLFKGTINSLEEKLQRDIETKAGFSAWVPNAPYSFFSAGQYAGCFAAFRLARGTGVFDVFALLFRHRRHCLVIQINKHRHEFKGGLRTFLHTFAAAVAFLSVNNNVVFA